MYVVPVQHAEKAFEVGMCANPTRDNATKHC
jgi:hypothetical protein